jgi:dCTP deaminase
LLLSDTSIKRINAIEPFNEDNLQAASYDLTLSNVFIVTDAEILCPGDTSLTRKCYSTKLVAHQYKLMPNEFILSSTIEKVRIPNNIGARFEGKSSLGRIGLATHITAGFIDPGFEGNITLEIKNEASYPILLTCGMKIGQICFYSMDEASSEPYGSTSKSHYQNQFSATSSWYVSSFTKQHK